METTLEYLLCQNMLDPAYNDTLNNCLSVLENFLYQTESFGAITKAGQSEWAYSSSNDRGLGIGIHARVIEGITYITDLVCVNFGLNLTHLTQLVQGLPHLEKLHIADCNRTQGKPPACALCLPAGLAEAAPNLMDLRIKGSNLQGTLPGSYGRLQHMQFLQLNDNNLSGTIPGVGGCKCLSLSQILITNMPLPW